MLQVSDIYQWLVSGGEPPLCERFDAHVVACSFALGIEAAQRSVPLTDTIGLSTEQQLELSGAIFPHAKELLGRLPESPDFSPADDELVLRDLLFRGSTGRTSLEKQLAVIIARRAQAPHHLWQDLGLRNRRELSWLMERHFEPLAARNAADMKWKKFLYRMMCRDADYALCTAPSCEECSDYAGCFGDEGGESLVHPQAADADEQPELSL